MTCATSGFRHVEHCLFEVALDNLHHAVGVGMIVNRRPFARVPDDEELVTNQHRAFIDH